MAEMITTGIWMVEESKQDAFLEEWAAFAGWASAMTGAETLRIGRDVADPSRFVSFGAWESADVVHAWKAHPEFRDRIARVLQHVDQFHPSELHGLALATAGTGTLTP